MPNSPCAWRSTCSSGTATADRRSTDERRRLARGRTARARGRRRARIARGASLVEAVWGDEAMQLARFRHAPRDSFSSFSAWLPNALAEHANAGGAVLSVYCNDPDLLEHEPADRAGALQQATSRSVMAISRADLAQPHELGRRRRASVPRGRRKVFPEVAAGEQFAQLWDAIARLCRLDRPGSDGRVARPPRRAQRAKRSAERADATRRCGSRVQAQTSPSGLPDGSHLGQRRVDQPQPDHVRAQSSDRGSLHDRRPRHASRAPCERPSR